MDNLSLSTSMELQNSSLSLPNLVSNSSQNISVTTIYKPDWIIVPSVFAFIFVVGVLGNGILILIVAVNRNMKTTPNVLLVSLATGDLLLIFISCPFTSVYYFNDEWPFGEIICKLNEFLFSLSLGVSVFTLTALSGERYMVIVFPMQSRRGANSMAKTILMAAMIWIVAALLASLDLYTAQVVYRQGGKKQIATCIPFPMEGMDDNPLSTWYPKFHTIFRFLVYFIVPIVIIATFYVCMAVILIRSSNNLPREAEAKGSTVKQVEARKNVARIVLACVFIFIICWLPRHIYQFWYYFDPGQYNMFWHLFKIFAFCLCFMNSCVNPFALYFLSDQFRRYYNRYLFRKLCCCFMPLCRKSSFMADTTTDDETVTSRKRSVLEMITLRTRGGTTNDKRKSTKASLTNDGEGGAETVGRLKNKFTILDGKRNSPDKKQNRRRSSNTANGRILQKLMLISKKEKGSGQDIEVDSKMTGQSVLQSAE